MDDDGPRGRKEGIVEWTKEGKPDLLRLMLLVRSAVPSKGMGVVTKDMTKTETGKLGHGTTTSKVTNG